MNEMKVVIKSVVKEELEGKTYQTESVQDQTTAIADKVSYITPQSASHAPPVPTATAAATIATTTTHRFTTTATLIHSPPPTSLRPNATRPDTKQAAGPTDASV